MKKTVFFLAAFFLVLGSGGAMGVFAQKAGYPRAVKQLVVALISGAPEVSTERGAQNISSIFVPIIAVDVPLPPSERAGMGGGLTASPAGGVLLLRFDGTFWHVTSDGTVEQLPIAPPQSNFDAYVNFSTSEEGAAYTHNLEWFRYNDIELISYNGRDRLLTSFSYYDAAAQCHANRIAMLTLTDGILKGTAAEWETLYTSTPCLPLKKEWRALEGHTAGGRLAYDGQEAVYIANGEFHFDGVYGPKDVIIAQDPNAHYGGIVRISLATGTADVLSRGNRNTQGLAIDNTGRVWISEHGVRGGDEINLLREGANYGWPYVSYGTGYSELPIATVAPEDHGTHNTYEKPLLAFLPSVAVSSLATVDNFDDTWNGDMLVGTLKGRMLIRIRTTGDRVVFAERIPIGDRIRDVQEINDGEIALWTDANKIIFLSKRAGGVGAAFVQEQIAKMSDRPEIQNAVMAAMGRCQECHSLNAGEHQGAPPLAGVLGRPVGKTGYDGYSESLRQSTLIWDEALLEEFLATPERRFSGTTMPWMEMTPEVRQEIISILQGLSTGLE